MILGMLASIAITSWEGNLSYGEAPMGELQPGSYGHTGGIGINATTGGAGSIEFTAVPKSLHFDTMTSFRSPMSFTAMEYLQITNSVLSGVGTMRTIATNSILEELSAERDALGRKYVQQLEEFQEFEDFEDSRLGIDVAQTLYSKVAIGGFRAYPEQYYSALVELRTELQLAPYRYGNDHTYPWNAYG